MALIRTQAEGSLEDFHQNLNRVGLGTIFPFFCIILVLSSISVNRFYTFFFCHASRFVGS